MNRTYRWVAGLAIVVLLFGFVEARFHLLGKLRGAAPLSQRELAMEHLGRYLAAHCAGKKALVIANPFSQKPGQPRDVYAFEKAALEGLRRGLGNAIKIETVAFPDLKPGFVEDHSSVFIDPTTTTPLSYVVTDDALDKIAAAHPQAELLVSVIGLPVKVRQTQTWRSSRKFALLLPDLRVLGDPASARQAMLSGKIAAMVINRPGAPPETEPIGKDSQVEFERRFLLVHSNNFDRVAQTYPWLFHWQ